jgi:hypothetical protein
MAIMPNKTGKIITMAKASNKAKVEPMAKETVKETKEVAFVASRALSLDVGEKAVAALKSVKDLDDSIKEMTLQNTAKKGETLALLTEAFFKAATEDKNIRLADIHSEAIAEQKNLRRRLEVAIGQTVAKRGEDGTEKFVLSPWAENYFPLPGEDKETGIGREKENFRTNWHATVSKCIKAAHAIQLKGLTVKKDQATGVLTVSGKAIKERFDVDTVALNEKREVKSGDGSTVKLKKIPSYTELARISAESVGKSLTTRVDSRAKEVNPLNEEDMAAHIRTMTANVRKLKNVGDDLASALDDLIEACQGALDSAEAA